MAHIMVDLETCGTTPDAAVLSIGACYFDPHGTLADDIGPGAGAFYRVIKLSGQQRVIDADTIQWWMQQSREARAEVFPPKTGVPGLPIGAAMKQFVEDFLPRDCSDLKMWSQGASFDIVIIEDILRQYKQLIPWRFWNHRDTRTAYDIAGYQPPKAATVAHVAWRDAVQQARQVQAAYAAVKGAVK